MHAFGNESVATARAGGLTCIRLQARITCPAHQRLTADASTATIENEAEEMSRLRTTPRYFACNDAVSQK
jgi:hypothetical protein